MCPFAWAYFQALIFVVLFQWNCAQTGTFWQISDVHWDKDYSRTGDPNNLCHGENIVEDNGYYGNSFCDTNLELMDISIRAMALIKPNPDFILWTGDNAPHINYPNITWDEVYKINRVIMEQLVQQFPSSIIITALGNHDTVPSDQFPSNDQDFYQAFLTQANWSQIIPEDQWETYKKGGYYSTVIGPGLKGIMLNTGLYLTLNKNVTELDPDPGHQFQWLLNELNQSRNLSQKVIISSHEAPGYFASAGTETLNLKPVFNDRLVELFANNFDVILTLIFGHEHMDTFRLFKDRDGVIRASAFLASSVDVWIYDPERGTAALNSGIRLYNYDLGTGLVTDYKQYYVDFMAANANVTSGHVCNSNATEGDSVCVCSQTTSGACALMQLLYQPTREYNVSDLSTASMTTIYEKLENDPATLEVFYNHSTLDYVLGPCDPSCRKWILCSIANVTDSDMKACLGL